MSVVDMVFKNKKGQLSFDWLFAILLLTLVLAALLPAISSSLSSHASSCSANSRSSFLVRSSFILQSGMFLPQHDSLPSAPIGSQSGSNCISDSINEGCVHMPLPIESRWGILQYGGAYGKTPV